ncbi:Pre-mRNA-splicing factor SYF2 [Elasticomyces elasticus]|nr:Pre-mRNA-splicing factor SYF2 [Elasticomyces elasticus]
MERSLKRKSPPGAEEEHEHVKRRLTEASAEPMEMAAARAEREPLASKPESAAQNEKEDDKEGGSGSTTGATKTTVPPAVDRVARWAALRGLAAEARKQNRIAVQAEMQRASIDPNALNKVSRKKEAAAQKLLKAETEADGEDFERKRAWDWTAEESEKWDKRLAKKAKARENNDFQDYRGEAQKVYKGQIGRMDLEKNKEAYEQQKREMIERAAQGGRLELVENESGELMAVDRDGKFYSTADNTSFMDHKPTPEALDRLVADLEKAEEVRLKKRKARGRQQEDGDVTYINEKNKQFNQKLARFYNKYTADIRESFERGTAL